MAAKERPTPKNRVPIVAIVGRPNVGKSTLLNALVHSRIAIVEQTPGVTRDRVGVLTELCDRPVEVMDTGGIGIVDEQGLEAHIDEQIGTAVEQADVVLFVVDARVGVHGLDQRVADRLRIHTDKVLLVANKVESERISWEVPTFEALGYGTPVSISAKERLKLHELEERIEPMLPDASADPDFEIAEPELQIAVVGRVNAGKSTLVNALLGDDRMIVSEVPGTTRDSVDLRFEYEGKGFVVIDTAGIRKERAVQGSVEFYAQRRAEKAMRRADVTVLVLDASIEVGRLDRQIADYAMQHYQPVVIVANKWDLCTGHMRPKDFDEYLDKALPGNQYAPIIFTSGIKGRNVKRIVEVAQGLYEQSKYRVSTADLNKILEDAYALRRPRPKQGRIGKIYYGSQVGTEPPTFVLFINERYLFPKDYIRFLGNRLREALPIGEIPIRIEFKERDRSPSKNDPR